MEIKKINNVLIELGLSPKLTGYEYVKECIKRVARNNMLSHNVNRYLYAQIADDYNTTIQNVEKNIRKCIENAKRDKDVWHFYFGYEVENITNKQFITTLAVRFEDE